MVVLVDYDNVPAILRNRGTEVTIDAIVDRLADFAERAKVFEVRLYGGWFTGSTLSPRAQSISALLRSRYPTAKSYRIGNHGYRVVVRASLALALAELPTKYLTHTYRIYSSPPSIVCATPPFRNCAIPQNCPLTNLHTFFDKTGCEVATCSTSLHDVLSKPEQKLVDTMLSIDLVHFARTTHEPIVVVSSDDDFWPAMLSTANAGAAIVHVHTKQGRGTPPHYATLFSGRYQERNIWN